MATRPQAETVDVFVVLNPFRELLPRLDEVLRPLDVLAERVVGLEGYASAPADAVLVNLRMPRSITERLGLERILAAMARDGLRGVSPESFSTGERRAFYLEYLTSYDTYIQVYGAGRGQLLELVRALAEHIAPPSAHHRALEQCGLPRPRRASPARADSVSST